MEGERDRGREGGREGGCFVLCTRQSTSPETRPAETQEVASDLGGARTRDGTSGEHERGEDSDAPDKREAQRPHAPEKAQRDLPRVGRDITHRGYRSSRPNATKPTPR